MTAEAVPQKFSRASLLEPFRWTMMPVLHANTLNKPHGVESLIFRNDLLSMFIVNKTCRTDVSEKPKSSMLFLRFSFRKQKGSLARTSQPLHHECLVKSDICHLIKSPALIKFWPSSCSCLFSVSGASVGL